MPLGLLRDGVVVNVVVSDDRTPDWPGYEELPDGVWIGWRLVDGVWIDPAPPVTEGGGNV